MITLSQRDEAQISVRCLCHTGNLSRSSLTSEVPANRAIGIDGIEITLVRADVYSSFIAHCRTARPHTIDPIAPARSPILSESVERTVARASVQSAVRCK